MNTFRAGTLNIWQQLGPWEARRPALRAALADVAPDVIGLQEVLRCPDLDQLALVSEGLGYQGVWGKASENYGYPLGNAILSRWPILRTDVIALPNGGSDESRSLVFAELDAPFGRVPFFCTHLNWKLHHGHVRVAQVKAIVQAMEALVPTGVGFPPVLVGDFNAEPESDEIRFLKGLTGLGGPCVYFADAFAVAGDGSLGATYSKRNPFAEPLREPERRIDYVFVRRPDDGHLGEPREARVVFDRAYTGTFPTDHFGVIATITAGH